MAGNAYDRRSERILSVDTGSIPVTSITKGEVMTFVKIQCAGSGKLATGVSLNANKVTCPSCGTREKLNSNGRIAKHMISTTKRRLKK